MSKRVMIDDFINFLRLEYHNDPQKNLWKIIIDDVKYKLFKGGIVFNSDLRNKFYETSFDLIKSAFYSSNIISEKKIRIFNFLSTMKMRAQISVTLSDVSNVQTDITKMNQELKSSMDMLVTLETKLNSIEGNMNNKLNAIEDKLALLISALDLQNQLK